MKLMNKLMKFRKNWETAIKTSYFVNMCLKLKYGCMKLYHSVVMISLWVCFGSILHTFMQCSVTIYYTFRI
jgi:hypothetical protein